MVMSRGTRVLVTGAAGMVGANLVRRLLAEGCEVAVLLRPHGNPVRLREIENRLHIVDGDITDAASVNAALDQIKPAVVFHLAAAIWGRAPAAAPATHVEVNTLGTLHFLEALRAYPQTRFVFTGSVSVYKGGARLREDAPLEPGSIYGASKAAASLLLQTYARLYRVHAVELRLFMPYGPWEHPTRLIPQTILAALEGRDIPMTLGTQQRDLVYMDDVVEALLLGATRSVPPGSVFHIGTGVNTTVRDLVERLLAQMGRPVKALVGAVPMRPDEIMEMSADISAARAHLGWEPRTTLDQGLRKAVAWFTEHRELVAELAGDRPMVASTQQSAPCLVCQSRHVEPFLDLGEMALANKFLTEEELAKPEPRYPLRVGFCQACAHVQLTDRVPPSAMFTDYLYVSSASETLGDHLAGLSDLVVKRCHLGPSDLVIDIGCNDGTLLKGFARHGVRTLGVDPAKNLAALSNGHGIERYVGFFTAQSAQEIVKRWGQASVITATNTFPHIPELPDFVQGIRTALAPAGTLVMEMHYLGDLLEQGAFDTVYHEHVSYWALGPMVGLFRQAGLEVVDVERFPIHHGQLRVFVQHAATASIQSSVDRLLQQERAAGLDRIDAYRQFADRVMHLKRALQEQLERLRAEGKRVVGYGAPAKGNTLLTFLGLGPEQLEYIADKSPLKQGRYTPGTRIPVVPPARLLEEQPDYVLVLAWNFADEIMAQQAEYRRRGGRFILPFPDVKVR